MSTVMRPDATVRNLEDGRKQALHALVSSLAPEGGSDGKLSDAQVDALTARLDHILGNTGDAPAERRNEKGQLLNEEGLPIVDISEPISDNASSSAPSDSFVSESDPLPLSRLSDMDRMQMRARTNHILDMLEAEEEQAVHVASERDRVQLVELPFRRTADAEAERARKLAAREMQKRMGKALLKNFTEQRAQEEKAQKAGEHREEEARSVAQSPVTLKPRKSVSFANVPEVDKETPKPKPSAAWGDVSLGALRAGMPKPKLKSEMLSSQPMKLGVVERVQGQQQASSNEQQDSDDESNPDVPDAPEDDEDDEETPPLYGDFDHSDASSNSDEDPDDDFDFTQASLQREIALEYIRLRETIGADAHQAMTAHSHEGEDEWDKPDVPLEATLSSKPPKPGISRFKADRQASRPPTTSSSISLGASVLPKESVETLQKAIRTGELDDGKLIGPDGDSASEDEEGEKRKQTLEMLKSGITIDTSSDHLNIPHVQGNSLQASPASPSIPALSPSASRFLAARQAYNKPEQPTAGPSKLKVDAVSSPAPVVNAVTERRMPSSTPTITPTSAKTKVPSGQAASQPFSKPPTAITVPKKTPSQSQQPRRPFGAPQATPDSAAAVLNTVIVDSPSFPPPGSTAAGASSNSYAGTPGVRHPPTLVREVRESTRGPGRGEPPIPAPSPTGRVSRFKAERM